LIAESPIPIEIVEKYEQTLHNLGSNLPEDIDLEKSKVLEFSKTLSKQLNNKMNTFEELKEMKEKASQFKILTAEIIKLSDYIQRTEEWISQEQLA